MERSLTEKSKLLASVESRKSLHASKEYGGSSNASSHQNSLRIKTEQDKSTLTPPKEAKLDFLKLPLNKKMILSLTMIGRFFMTASLSIFNPVFPKEAEAKDINSFFMNFVFGILYAIIFFTAPIYGRYLGKLGPKRVLVFSIYLGAISNLGFGFLHYADGGTTYLLICILCRCVLALAFSGYSTASQTIVSYEFIEKVSLANGLLQTGGIAGYMMGPALSGFLFELGGYSISFYLIGGLILILAVLSQFFIAPTKHNTTANNEEIKGNGPTVGILLSNPYILVNLMTLTIGMIGMSNIDSTLTLHLEPFNLSLGYVGLIFATMDILNSVANICWSYLTEKLHSEREAIIFGHGLSTFAFLTLGPAPFLSFIPLSLIGICVSLAFVGLAYGSTLIPAMTSMMLIATEMGYDNNLQTLGVISGLFNAVLMLGGFFGQFVLGLISTAYPISYGYSVISLLNVLAFVVNIISLILRRRRKKENYDDIDNGLSGEIDPSVLMKHRPSLSMRSI